MFFKRSDDSVALELEGPLGVRELWRKSLWLDTPGVRPHEALGQGVHVNVDGFYNCGRRFVLLALNILENSMKARKVTGEGPNLIKKIGVQVCPVAAVDVPGEPALYPPKFRLAVTAGLEFPLRRLPRLHRIQTSVAIHTRILTISIKTDKACTGTQSTGPAPSTMVLVRIPSCTVQRLKVWAQSDIVHWGGG